MPIYTRKGDQEKTTNFSGEELSKADLKVEVLGGLDELNSSLGAVRSFLSSDSQAQKIGQILLETQKILMSITSETALHNSMQGKANLKLNELPTTNLEKMIDHYELQLSPIKNFIIPGGSPAAAMCHVSRTICRRTERLVVSLNEQEELNPNILKFMNRLSDLLFVLARKINQIEGHEDIVWQTGGSSQKSEIRISKFETNSNDKNSNVLNKKKKHHQSPKSFEF